MNLSKEKCKLKIFVIHIRECNFLCQVFDIDNVQL